MTEEKDKRVVTHCRHFQRCVIVSERKEGNDDASYDGSNNGSVYVMRDGKEKGRQTNKREEWLRKNNKHRDRQKLKREKRKKIDEVCKKCDCRQFCCFSCVATDERRRGVFQV